MDLLWVSTNMLSLGYILNNMQKCEIMLNDLIGSKRTNTNIKATIAQPSHTAIIMQFQDQKRMVGMERLGESFIRKVRLRYEVNIVEFVVGLPAADAPKKISRVHKRGWRYILSLSKSTESLSSVSKPTETAPATPEVQPA
ncbi:uncharacterized protein LOC133714075 isoform X1 [Rosa rugosa]|uniref:uncharacterized protein LOC133714075 isoform X1 n=1 Tax=Rosa rugosa TaxID=74645 RepID=UPI002B405F0B|nr:uncharacterized protein LOC133714075 isoform X1 [Rosa rugosa]XP_061996101.1 uncharacterized protein LOC133714075 isoform X1 [Rosa rugosa]